MKPIAFTLVLVFTLLGTDAGLAGGGVSNSKLSIHLINRYTAGAHGIVTAGPPVLKILDLGGDMRAALREYKTAYPDGLSVLRIYTPISYSLRDNPEASAQDFWDRVLWPPLSGLPPEERQLIDYLEGPNEGDSTPTWGSVENARWFSRFWVALIPLIQQAGLRPCIGSISVGNPPGPVDQIEAQLEAFVPALLAAQDADGAWSYHAYTVQYVMDAGVEYWYSLRYRLFYDFLQRRHPELAWLPMILTEGGVDAPGGWRQRGDAQRFITWLHWYDSQLQRDPYVLGVTLFQSGNTTDWASFDIEPIAGWLADHLWAAR